MIEHLNSHVRELKVGQLFFIGIPGRSMDGPTRGLADRLRQFMTPMTANPNSAGPEDTGEFVGIIAETGWRFNSFNI
jgi:hypothetical protein